MSPLTRAMGEKLASCAGYTVRNSGGDSVGKVAWVRYGTRADCPDTLVVRPGSSFASRRRTVDISTVRVGEVDASTRTITLA